PRRPARTARAGSARSRRASAATARTPRSGSRSSPVPLRVLLGLLDQLGGLHPEHLGDPHQQREREVPLTSEVPVEVRSGHLDPIAELLHRPVPLRASVLDDHAERPLHRLFVDHAQSSSIRRSFAIASQSGSSGVGSCTSITRSSRSTTVLIGCSSERSTSSASSSDLTSSMRVEPLTSIQPLSRPEAKWASPPILLIRSGSVHSSR